MLPTNNKQLARRQAAAKFDEVLSSSLNRRLKEDTCSMLMDVG